VEVKETDEEGRCREEKERMPSARRIRRVCSRGDKGV
jgi:hypothetical protein